MKFTTLFLDGNETKTLKEFLRTWEGYQYNYIDVSGAEVDEFRHVVSILKKALDEVESFSPQERTCTVCGKKINGPFASVRIVNKAFAFDHPECATERIRQIEQANVLTFIKRDYWSKGHRPYRNVLHNHADSPMGLSDTMERLLQDVPDGEEIEIIVRQTGRRPFGDRRYIYQEPHTYGPETDEQMKERLESERKDTR